MERRVKEKKVRGGRVRDTAGGRWVGFGEKKNEVGHEEVETNRAH